MITKGTLKSVPSGLKPGAKQVIKWSKKMLSKREEIEIFCNEINISVCHGIIFEISIYEDCLSISGVLQEYSKTDIREYPLTEEGFQKGIKKTIELMKTELGKGLNSILRKRTSSFTCEGNRYGFFKYPADYKPKIIEEQINIIQRLFPEITVIDPSFASQPLPEEAESWFVVPKWELIAQSYNKAVKRALDLMEEKYRDKFYNWCKWQYHGNSWIKKLYQNKDTVEKLKILNERQQDSDVLIFPAQFGYRHRDRSVPRAYQVFSINEFGLGIFEIACMLLTHSKRLNHNGSLWIDCADQYEQVPCFAFKSKQYGLELDIHPYNEFDSRLGLATGFIPN
jgi:hypothetical protein